jgi:hypothetical protein
VPGGRFVLGIGDPDAMAKIPFTTHGFRLRPLTTVEAALAKAGLAVERRDEVRRRDLPFRLLVTRLPG